MHDRPRGPSGPRRRARPGVRASSRAPGTRVAPGTPAGATRPATRRGGVPGSGTATRTSAPRPPGRFTGRAIILGVVLLALAMSYVFPLRVYLSQQADIAQFQERQAAQRQYIGELEAEAARWADHEYVRIQARKRLYFVEPGEVPMITVWEEDGEPDPDTDPGEAPERVAQWWHTLWSSVEAADRGGPVAPGLPGADAPSADGTGDGTDGASRQQGE